MSEVRLRPGGGGARRATAASVLDDLDRLVGSQLGEGGAAELARGLDQLMKLGA